MVAGVGVGKVGQVGRTGGEALLVFKLNKVKF